MATQSIIVPDLGDFSSVDVIEVLVKVGDSVKKEDSLITLETDKASMEVPAPADGVIATLTVKVGDKVSAGDSIGTLESEGGSATSVSTASPVTDDQTVENKQPTPVNTIASSAPEGAVDMLVIGAGPAGYSAAFRAADLGMKVTLIERHNTLGGVCLNVGCIPSKALLHVCEVIEEAHDISNTGITFEAPKVNIDMLRAHKESVINKLTGGLAGMAKGRKVNVVHGTAKFANANEVIVTDKDGSTQNIPFKQCIIAAGSRSIKLPFMPNDDSRVMDSTGALALQDVPKRLLIIGGGIIGLEMATVYATLGSKVDIVEMADTLMAGADKDLVKVWEKRNNHRFNNIMTSTKTVAATAEKNGIHVTFEGTQAPTEPQCYDRVLVAVGRAPNGHELNLQAAGVYVNERGFIKVDKQMRTTQANIFAVGDIVGQPMLAHKGVHEAHVAAQVAAGDSNSYFDARVIPSVAYTSPEVAWAGVTELQAAAQNLSIRKAIFPWAASGRAIANGCDYGFTKLIIDKNTNRVVGGALVGPNAGDMISEVALAIEMDATVEDIAFTIHPHPTLGESIGMAAEVAEGSCTDLPPQKKA
ncbi:MAG: dihydrolipoyl dehydrogenase [Cardiobacteriaceae bacterium]|nr:dihydrolipoyl dehydrogenase [Cardiobacteriaceae bacterium]